ncbi:MAG TPA: hypothetical protein VGC53_00385 [Vicinamibacteria bacterium]|jgi:predicted NAD/FAD-dependent oxidoreductase
MKKARVILFVLLLLPSVLLADTVYLKGGGKVAGRIVTRTETEVQVDVGAGTIKVPMARRISKGLSSIGRRRGIEYHSPAKRVSTVVTSTSWT